MVKNFESRTGQELDVFSENPSTETQKKLEKLNKEFAKMVSDARA